MKKALIIQTTQNGYVVRVTEPLPIITQGDDLYVFQQLGGYLGESVLDFVQKFYEPPADAPQS